MPIIPIRTEAPLFYSDALDAFIRLRLKQAHSVIAGHGVDELLTTPIEDQIDAIVAQFQLVVPKLREDLAHSDEPQETIVDMNDYCRQISVPSARYQVRVPFEGQKKLFELRHLNYYPSFPCAIISDHELIISLVAYNITADDIDKEIDKIISEVKQYLEWQRGQVAAFNKELRDSPRTKIEERKARILAPKRIAASLRYPLKRRADAPLTYVSSELRRKIVPTVRPSKGVTTPFAPEPTIEEVEYQHILKVMDGMALMMERSPSTFVKLGEEEIRDFFLLVLNGYYEGGATGETFNGAGKTDILVRDCDRNVFIAECKIWGGGKLFLEAIDQLLRYLTWRDTKSAVLIFSRTKDFSGVLHSINNTIEQHPHRKRGAIIEGETRFRYVFGNPDDHNREIIVTVMAFSVVPPPIARPSRTGDTGS